MSPAPKESVVMDAPEPGVSKKYLLMLSGFVILAIAAAVYLYIEYAALTQDPNVANQKKIEEAVAKVEKLIDLPQNEIPTLATITDPKQLEGQPFFVNAQMGDQVLLYTNARKAYLYNPSKNIIVEVASLNIGE